MGHKYFRRRRKSDLSASSEAVAATLEALGLTDQAKTLRIHSAWNAAVGHPLATRAMPHSFQRGTLVLKAASAAWQNELAYLKEGLISKLNGALGATWIKDIRLISGHLPQPQKEPPEKLPTARQKAQAQTAATCIADPEIRTAFEHLMLRDLGSRKA